jgi:hypothetical protein
MNQSNEEKGPQSIAPEHELPNKQAKPGGTRVAASPFNGIKLDLGFILFGAVVLLLTEFVLAWPGSWGLAGYSLLCALWLVWRTRTVARRTKAQQQGERH